MQFPETDDYRIEIHGINEEAEYVIINKHTEVWELRSPDLPHIIREMVMRQADMNDILASISNGTEIELIPDDKGSVH